MLPIPARVGVGARLLLLAGLLAMAVGCSSSSPASPSRTGISRERAIEIARVHVTFTPTTVLATTETLQGRPTWAVTFRGADAGGGQLGQFMEVWVDRQTGEIVSLAMS